MMSSRSLQLNRLQSQLHYQFKDLKWLDQALTHRSFGGSNNERLEFVGDSILNYTVARMLYDRFTHLKEGDLSRLRANLVNQATLAQIAIDLKLGDLLRLGEGELKSNGFNRPSILADSLEAIFAAVSLDSDFYTAEAVVRVLYQERIINIDPNIQAKDAKSRLQELLQGHRLSLPRYRIVEQTGDAHEQEFKVACDLLEIKIETLGVGASRRQAEQQAAEKAMALLETRFKKV